MSIYMQECNECWTAGGNECRKVVAFGQLGEEHI